MSLQVQIEVIRYALYSFDSANTYKLLSELVGKVNELKAAKGGELIGEVFALRDQILAANEGLEPRHWHSVKSTIFRESNLNQVIGLGANARLEACFHRNYGHPDRLSQDLSEYMEFCKETLMSYLQFVKTAEELFSSDLLSSHVEGVGLEVIFDRDSGIENLEALEKASREWNMFFSALQKATGAELDPIRIRSMAHGIMAVELTTDPKVVSTAAECVANLLDAYAKRLEISELQERIAHLESGADAEDPGDGAKDQDGGSKDSGSKDSGSKDGGSKDSGSKEADGDDDAKSGGKNPESQSGVLNKKAVSALVGTEVGRLLDSYPGKDRDDLGLLLGSSLRYVVEFIRLGGIIMVVDAEDHVTQEVKDLLSSSQVEIRDRLGYSPVQPEEESDSGDVDDEGDVDDKKDKKAKGKKKGRKK